MNNHERAVEHRLEANRIYAEIIAMQLLMTNSIDELVGTIYEELSVAGAQAVRDTQDRIFGYRIQMEAMHVRALGHLQSAYDLDATPDE